MYKQRLCTALQGPCKNTIGTYLISVCCTRLQSLKPWFDSDSTLLIVIFRHLRPIPQPLPPRSSSRDGRPLSSPGGNRPVTLHRFKSTNDVEHRAYASTNGVRRDACGWAAPGAPTVVSGRAQCSVGFEALL